MTTFRSCPAESVAGRDKLAAAMAARGVVPLFNRRFNANYDFDDETRPEDEFLGFERFTPFSHEEILISADKIEHNLTIYPIMRNGYTDADRYEAPHIQGATGPSLDPDAIDMIARRCGEVAVIIANQIQPLESMTWAKALAMGKGVPTAALAYAEAGLQNALRMRYPTSNSPINRHNTATFAAPHLAMIQAIPLVRIADTLDSPYPGAEPVKLVMNVRRPLDPAEGDLPHGYSVEAGPKGEQIVCTIAPSTFADFYIKAINAGERMASINSAFYEGFRHEPGKPVMVGYGT